MKFLFTTDWHLSNKIPSSRTELYINNQWNKVKEILKIAFENKVDFILHGGDLFDEYDIDFVVISNLVDVLKDSKIPFYVVPGNHDLFGNNVESLNKCAIYITSLTKVIELLIKPKFIDGIKFVPVLPNQVDKIDWIGDVYIVHNLVTPTPLPFKHILCSELDLFDNKLFLCGDFHYPFEYKGKSLFLNPGCIGRRSISEKDIELSVYIIEMSPFKYQKIKLKNVVNDFHIKEKDEKFSFLDKKIDVDFSNFRVKDIILEVGKKLKISEEANRLIKEEIDKYV
jgi:exonuclease SbcD